MSLSLSMAAFALAASISPGPVNLVALGAGARHGLRPALRHVTGATLGFCLLLLLVGYGLHAVLRQWPGLTEALRWAGILFLLYMAWKLAANDGRLGDGSAGKPPSMGYGALMQWLNPKAWLACVAGVGAFVGQAQACANLKRALNDAYRQVADLKVKDLLQSRYERLQAMGRFNDTTEH